MWLTTLLRIAPVVTLCGSGAMAAGAICPPGTNCKLFPPCQQSMLQGNWEIFINVLQSADVCPVTIAANGSFTTPGSCANNGFSYIKRPSGTLTIDSSCHVTGSFSYSFSDGSFNFSSVSMWNSADGSRVSGYGVGKLTESGQTQSLSGVPLELVYRTTGQ